MWPSEPLAVHTPHNRHQRPVSSRSKLKYLPFLLSLCPSQAGSCPTMHRGSGHQAPHTSLFLSLSLSSTLHSFIPANEQLMTTLSRMLQAQKSAEARRLGDVRPHISGSVVLQDASSPWHSNGTVAFGFLGQSWISIVPPETRAKLGGTGQIIHATVNHWSFTPGGK